MRIPNMSKVKMIDINEPIYDLRRYDDVLAPDNLVMDLSDEKSKVNFVKYIETLVRSSYEYKQMIQFLRDKLDMNYCAYFRGVNNKINGITIEIHHEPFSLYDITYIVLAMFIDYGYPIESAYIAQEVIKLHYYGIIGLIPLSKTVHELVHASQIFIPITYTFGNVTEFFLKYQKYMTQQQKDIVYRSISLAEKLEKTDPHVLKKQFIYLDVDGMVLPSKIKKKKKEKR